MRRLLYHWKYTCDGFISGKKCLANKTVSAYSANDADCQMSDVGWRFDNRGWICPADGHRGDHT